MISRLIGLANNYKKINNITEQKKRITRKFFSWEVIFGENEQTKIIAEKRIILTNC